jgi:hypothetical protein
MPAAMLCALGNFAGSIGTITPAFMKRGMEPVSTMVMSATMAPERSFS